MDEERKYLEGLLKERFNFFLVFASIVVAGTVAGDGVDPAVEQLIYIAAVFVSVPIGLAILRTDALVNRALSALPDGHAYRVIAKKPVRFLPARANSYLVWVALPAVVLLFVVLLISSLSTHGFALR